MNGPWDIQRALVASHQAELRHEADATRIAADATFAASAERTRHAPGDDTTGHMVAASPPAAASPAVTPAAQSATVAPKPTTCDGSAACDEGALAA